LAKLVSNYTANGSSTTDEYGTFIVLNRFLQGDVVEGFAVVANSSPNMTVYVQPGSGRITTGTYPASYGYLISHDTGGQGEAVTIATAAASPRIDYVVSYIDKTVAGSTSGANVNNTNNVLKFASVAGTPSGSPVVPTTAQIQAAIGAANPYSIYGQIAVGANVTQITNANITDKRVMVSPVRVSIPNASVTPAMRTGGFKAGKIAASTFSTTGSKAITGVGFTPKLIRFTLQPAFNGSFVGVGTGVYDGTNQYSTASASSGSASGRNSSDTRCMLAVDQAGSIVLNANCTSFDADGFTFTNNQANTAFDFYYEAYA
jgi:hypothetical protein